MRHREKAICLRTTDYSETSQVVQFLTRGQGVVRILAKGSKRPKSKSGGMIDLLSEGELVFSGQGRESLGTLIEFSESAVHSGIRREARRLNAALCMIEMVSEMLPADDIYVEVFDLLHNGLARLDQDDCPVRAVLAYFQWRLLRHAGLLGDLSGCVLCGEEIATPSAYFSSIQGGMLCPDCHGGIGEKFPVDDRALAGLAVLQAVSGGKRVPLPETDAHAAIRVLTYHIEHQLGKRLRMAKYC